MNKRQNAIRLVRESIAGENAQDYDRMYSVFTPELTFHLNGKVLASGKRDVFAAGEKATTPSTFANAHREIQWLDATDDRVVCQYRLRFTHAGTVFGFAPTGNLIDVHGMFIAEHHGTAISAEHFFTDQGEMNRQLSGKLRTPGPASAGALGPPIPEGERTRYEAVGERLIRTVYEAANRRDLEAELACYADPLLDHYAGRANAMSLSRARTAFPAFYAADPKLQREVEEVINLGNRSVLRWHLTSEDADGSPISQHGCSVVEHDGEKIRKFWAYYPDLAQLLPAIVQLK